jgi:hypothetical protein
MQGSSGIPLVKKLGFKEEHRIYIIESILKNAPQGCFHLIECLPENTTILKRLAPEIDVVHLFTKSKDEMSVLVSRYMLKIKSKGAIWVSWQKKSSKVETNITEDVIREVALPMGLVDIKVCSVNDVWSGLK